MTARALAGLTLAVAGCGLIGYGDGGGDPSAACYASIAIGDDHTCVANRGGRVFCWGADDRGQSSGTPGGGPRPTPVEVTLPLSASVVAAGPSTTCAITDDHQVRCWGARKGGVGLPDYPAPTVVDVGGPAYKVGLGDGYACAKVGPDDHVACWGAGDQRRLGQTNDDAHQTWVMVPGPSAVFALAVGARTTCAVQGDLRTWCWGDNRSGQLALGNTDDLAREATPVDELAGTEAIAMGDQLGCALAGDAIRCWGANHLGQLGLGRVGPPALVPGDPLATDVASMAVMANAACSLHWDGAVRCWGQNRAGELGTGDLRVRTTPTIIDAVRGARAVAGGPHQACVEKDDALWCWGSNLHGQLGRGSLSSRTTPRPLGVGTTFTAVRGGGGTLCAIDDDQQLWCWGDGERGQTGLGVRQGETSPQLVRAGVREVAIGGLQTCARDDTTVWCWGNDVLVPTGWLTGSVVTAVALGADHGCAIVDGGLRCWGSNWAGQVGTGSTLPAPTPVPVALARPPLKLALGEAHTCAIDTTGALWCWGAGGEGRLGNGGFDDQLAPVAIDHPVGGRTFSKIAAGRAHTCAVDNVGELWCWGTNGAGQLGSQPGPSPQPRKAAWPPPPDIVRDVYIASDITCAILTTGLARCWGADGYGAIGTGGSTPRPFGTLTDIGSFGGGAYNLCAITGAGELFCAGAGDRGGLGSDFVGWNIAAVDVPCE